MHYICIGECEGVSETAKNCGDPACSKHNQPLQPCDCKDGKHIRSTELSTSSLNAQSHEDRQKKDKQ